MAAIPDAVPDAVNDGVFGFPAVPAGRAEEINEKVGSVYRHTAAAFAATSVSAWAFAKLGLGAKMITLLTSVNPLLTLCGVTALTIALIFKTLATPTKNVGEKQAWFGAFAVWQGLILSPFVLVNAPACAFAATATVGVTGALGAASLKMQAQLEKYEKILFVALGAIALCSIGAVVFGGTVVGAVAGKVSLFAGLAAFSAFIIYDTQQVRKDALQNEKFDAVNHALNIYQDMINMAIRLFELYDRYVGR